ncbi:hypothetical protein SAY86_004316 [Trapa natans]|uniref:Uncharacterized protein n=1 Tax=Trapa natans TaxID=22666 RepID=A0AAN7RFI9_TRANT|nr:hypothetical protein SAY86_004316 [Trapa natans]
MQKLIDKLEEKLQGLLIFHHKDYDGSYLDLFDALSQIGEYQHNAHQKISEIAADNESILKERDAAQASLTLSESEREYLKNFLSELQEKLQDLLISYDKNINKSSLELMIAFPRLEELLHDTHQKISNLIEENQVLTRERDSAQSSFSQLACSNLAMKRKFESDLHDVLAKANISESLVKLQAEFEIIAGKL